MSTTNNNRRATWLGATLLAMMIAGAQSPAMAQRTDTPPMPKIKKIAAPKVVDDPVLVSVLAGAQRPDADKARDGARHPLESLTFWGLRPGATVLEMLPGAGYWVRILAPYELRTHGR